jgi:hypothetical protein
MLNKQFHHAKWFKGNRMTVKEFLDYILSVRGNFHIKKKFKSIDNSLFVGYYDYYLTDGNSSYKLDKEDCAYLAAHNNYFKSKLMEV